ncbi:MAG: 6-bladed beta-propeller [Bacteroidales bacterium]|jgi:hypothetical protein|nr:6-bladed beta-propeller [Bacteroidales bacterium]MDY0198158.1 6-bladed beta-propeller [Tenuifilaceae bacterium]
MKKKYLLLSFLVPSILTIITLNSCVTKLDNNEITKIEVNLRSALPEKIISEIFSEISLVKLETTPTSFMGEINKIFLADNKIYVSDGSSVYLFTRNGKFLKRLHNPGKGPGEYTEIYDFIVDKNKTIEILNSGMQKVLRFDSSFNYIDEYKINRYSLNMALMDDDVRLFHCGNDAPVGQNDKILKFARKKQIGHYLKIDKLKSNYLHLRRFDYFSYFNNEVLVTDAHHDTIYSCNGKIFEPKYVVDIGKDAVPKQMYAKQYRNIADFDLNHMLGSGYSYGIFNFIESKQNLLFHYAKRISNEISPYGKLNQIFVHYNKFNKTSEIFSHIIDDVNFPENSYLPEHTTLFSQPNGSIAYEIQAFSFIEIYNKENKNSSLRGEIEHFPSTEIFRTTKLTDNPIIVIATPK